MTLRRRLTVQIAVMIAGVVLLGAAAVMGVEGLHQDFGVALRADEQVRQIYTIGVHVAAARTFLDRSPASTAKAREELNSAVVYLDLFAGSHSGNWVGGTSGDVERVRRALIASANQLQQQSSPDGSILEDTYARLADLSAATRRTISDTQMAADRKHRITLVCVVALSIAIAVAAVLVGYRQYVGVMVPLGRLQSAVRNVASGRLSDRVAVSGDDEFARLAGDFNRMAQELKTVYDELERRIESKSRELVRSERLASVGYLAAGVAHEINNPLGIIAGYGERSLQRLDRDHGNDTLGYVRKAIKVMCDESFRCKEITDRLLMLARPGDNARRNLSLADLAHEVVTSVSGLKRFAERRLTFEAPSDTNLVVHGNEGELRQVILNLLVNAFEAVAPNNGHVHVSVFCEQKEIVLTVRDNGLGMTAETTARVFEPFFTGKRGERPGTGLGLSVAHSIVMDHNGRIEAHSDGIGMGSLFSIHLPAALEASCPA